MRTLVQVTPNDIRTGNRKCKSTCPVAKAIDRLGYCSVVFPDMLFCRELGSLYPKLYKAPRSVTRFVKAFDAGKPVKPFNFFLEAA